MFRDTQEELERLQAQLLEETEEEENTSEEAAFLDEEDFDTLLYDTDQGENPRVYENYSNDYGSSLRNFATGYKAYNSDRTDTDLDAFSENVFEGKEATYGWVWIILCLMVAAIVGILWCFLSMGDLI